jgi:transcriptional regulator
MNLKLTDKKVEMILALKKEGMKNKDIAIQFGITADHVSSIWTRSHKHLKDNNKEGVGANYYA